MRTSTYDQLRKEKTEGVIDGPKVFTRDHVQRSALGNCTGCSKMLGVINVARFQKSMAQTREGNSAQYELNVLNQDCRFFGLNDYKSTDVKVT